MEQADVPSARDGTGVIKKRCKTAHLGSKQRLLRAWMRARDAQEVASKSQPACLPVQAQQQAALHGHPLESAWPPHGVSPPPKGEHTWGHLLCSSR